MTLRSSRWFSGHDEVALEHRAAMRAAGSAVEPSDERPVIGVVVSSSGLNPCNLPLEPLSSAVADGVRAAGGVPVVVPTLTLGEDLMKPTAMLYRNLLAIEVEEVIRAHPLDGVVLMGGCDKTIPAQLMGAASADVPAIQLAGGYRQPGRFRGREVGAGTDLWTAWDERRAGRLDDTQWRQLEAALGCSQGSCNVMGTAMTMSILAEALGMMLPGAATLPSGDPRLTDVAVASGSRAVDLARTGTTPSTILDDAAFGNALLVLAAIGGSTNAVVHLCALAGRRGLSLPLDAFDEAARRVPVLVDVAPTGSRRIRAFDEAGGVPALLAVLEPLLDQGVTTVADPRRHGARPAPSSSADPAAPPTAIHQLDDPVTDQPSLVVLHGNLCPDGSVLKASAASPELLQHTGPAVVFRSYHDMLDRVDDPELDVTPESVLVLTGCGPRGGDGFPEWGMIPIPRKLAVRDVTDMVRVSDARMSGTSFGTCVLHVAPDAASGGPLALVEDGDLITLDVAGRRLHVHASDANLAARRAALPHRPPRHARGWRALYDQHVLQAPDGADLAFLRASPDAELSTDEPVVGRS